MSDLNDGPYDEYLRAMNERVIPAIQADLEQQRATANALRYPRRADPLVEELRGALEPFAAEAPGYDDGEPYRRYFSVKDVRRAREALALPVGNISACTDSAGEEPDGSFAGEAQIQSEGRAS